jgi:hypothetical protein
MSSNPSTAKKKKKKKILGQRGLHISICSETLSQKTKQNKKSFSRVGGHGSSGRVPAYQVQDPKFKPQYHTQNQTKPF